MEKFKQFIKKNRRIVIIAAVALFIVVLAGLIMNRLTMIILFRTVVSWCCRCRGSRQIMRRVNINPI